MKWKEASDETGNNVSMMTTKAYIKCMNTLRIEIKIKSTSL